VATHLIFKTLFLKCFFLTYKKGERGVRVGSLADHDNKDKTDWYMDQEGSSVLYVLPLKVKDCQRPAFPPH
jgi:hypothetical protein